MLNGDGTTVSALDASGVRTFAGLSSSDAVTFASITCGVLIGDTNLIWQRNSTNAQTFRVAGTYTSATNFETLQVQAKSTEHCIGSAIGSAGGTNRDLKFGHWNSAGTFTTALTVTTGSFTSGVVLEATDRFQLSSLKFSVRSNIGVVASSDQAIGFSSGTNNANAGSDTAIQRDSAGVLKVTSGGLSGSLRDLKVRDLIAAPSASITPASNGDLVVEKTSNTTLTFKLKGSDGTVRSGTITLT